jgi:hypothetical protein
MSSVVVVWIFFHVFELTVIFDNRKTRTLMIYKCIVIIIIIIIIINNNNNITFIDNKAKVSSL